MSFLKFQRSAGILRAAIATLKREEKTIGPARKRRSKAIGNL
jgi:hypothetical protein